VSFNPDEIILLGAKGAILNNLEDLKEDAQRARLSWAVEVFHLVTNRIDPEVLETCALEIAAEAESEKCPTCMQGVKAISEYMLCAVSCKKEHAEKARESLD